MLNQTKSKVALQNIIFKYKKKIVNKYFKKSIKGMPCVVSKTYFCGHILNYLDAIFITSSTLGAITADYPSCNSSFFIQKIQKGIFFKCSFSKRNKR